MFLYPLYAFSNTARKSGKDLLLSQKLFFIPLASLILASPHLNSMLKLLCLPLIFLLLFSSHMHPWTLHREAGHLPVHLCIGPHFLGDFNFAPFLLLPTFLVLFWPDLQELFSNIQGIKHSRPVLLLIFLTFRHQCRTCSTFQITTLSFTFLTLCNSFASFQNANNPTTSRFLSVPF